jgi:hypothetical protein
MRPAIDLEVQPRYAEIRPPQRCQMVWPFEDELVTSWLHRLAIANSLAPREFADILGLGRGMGWARIDLDIPDSLVERLSGMTGVAAPDIRAMAYPSGLPPRLLLPARVEAGPEQSAWVQFCPICIGEGYLKREWRLCHHIYCDRHDRFLLDRCPDCGAPIQSLEQTVGSDLSSCAACGLWLSSRRGKTASPKDRKQAAAVSIALTRIASWEAREGLAERTGLGEVINGLTAAVSRDQSDAETVPTSWGFNRMAIPLPTEIYTRAGTAPLRQLGVRQRAKVLGAAYGRFLTVFHTMAVPEAMAQRANIVQSLADWWGRPEWRVENPASLGVKAQLDRLDLLEVRQVMVAAADFLSARLTMPGRTFRRGQPSVPEVDVRHAATLYELLRAYGDIRSGKAALERLAERESLYPRLSVSIAIRRDKDAWVALQLALSGNPPGREDFFPEEVLATYFQKLMRPWTWVFFIHSNGDRVGAAIVTGHVLLQFLVPTGWQNDRRALALKLLMGRAGHALTRSPLEGNRLLTTVSSSSSGDFNRLGWTARRITDSEAAFRPCNVPLLIKPSRWVSHLSWEYDGEEKAP